MGPEIYATIFALAPSTHDANTIWAGSDDGMLHITRDGGATWNDITPPDLPKYSRVSIIDESPHAPGTAYVAANRYQVDDRGPYVFRTRDYGASWTTIVDGIAPGHFARAVREDPVRPGLLFLCTEHGVYVSFNAGDRWQSLQLNLPDTPVRDLVVKGSDVVLGTHGRRAEPSHARHRERGRPVFPAGGSGQSDGGDLGWCGVGPPGRALPRCAY